MAVEDVIAGAAVALAATWFASWLHKRETGAERRGQEDRLRALLASEIEANLVSIFISRKVDREIPQLGTPAGPTFAEPRRELFNTLASNPTSLPSAETLAAAAFYAWLEVTVETAKALVGVSDPDIRRAYAELWNAMTPELVRTGIEALEALKATVAVGSVRAEAAALGLSRDRIQTGG